MNPKKSVLFTFIFLIIAIQNAFAATGLSYIDGPFRMLSQILHNTNIVFGLTLIFFFSLLYGIYAAALKFVPVFKSGEGISHQAKVVGLSLAGLTTLSIFYFTRGSPEQILKTVLDPFGVFGGLMLAILFAGIVYFGIRGNDPNSKSLAWAAVAAGFGMVIAGLITTQDSMMAWGFLIMLIAMIFALFSGRFGVGHGDHGHGSDTHAPGVNPPAPGGADPHAPGGADPHSPGDDHHAGPKTPKKGLFGTKYPKMAAPTVILHDGTPPISGINAPENSELTEDPKEHKESEH